VLCCVDEATVVGFVQAVSDFVKGAGGESEEFSEVFRIVEAACKALGRVVGDGADRVADLIAELEIPRSGLGFNNCEYLLLQLSCELPGNELFDRSRGHATRSSRFAPFEVAPLD
jgi:hypothetical protein